MPPTAVVMPAYNEGRGIGGFLEELCATFGEDVVVIVCDDCSTDDTVDQSRARGGRGLPVRVEEGTTNAGHGPTTVRALRAGLASGADVVVAVDGDGQFSGRDVAAVAERVRLGREVVEGARRRREQPLFRHAISGATRLLVWARSRRLPMDANTPLRAYRASTLERLLEQVPDNAITPNLVISTVVRRSGIDYEELPVDWLPRRGEPGSSAFGALRRLPSRRFVGFCLRASREWLGMSR